MRRFFSSFLDLDDMHHSMRAWDVELLPVSTVRSDGPVGEILQLLGSDEHFGYSTFTHGLSMLGSPPPGRITFNVMEPNPHRYWMRGHDLDDGMVWVLPVGGELRSFSVPGFGVYSLSIKEAKIEEFADSNGLTLPRPGLRPEVFRPHPQVLNTLLGTLRSLRHGCPEIRSACFDAAFTHLVNAWIETVNQSQGRAVKGKTRDRAARRFLELLDEPELASLTIQALQEKCGASERTLQYAIQDRFGVTPITLLKSRRLAYVRSSLQKADPMVDTVGALALKQGFRHLSQFSADYRKAFGERPSDTLRGCHDVN